LATIEKIILSNLIRNEDFSRKVIPFLREEYFQSKKERTIYTLVNDYIVKYNSEPTKSALVISLNDRDDMTQDEHSECEAFIAELYSAEPEHDEEWLVYNAEKFCKDKAIYNAILDSIHILDGKDSNKTKNNIPSILSDALSVSFDNNVGHDYIEDVDKRYDYYHKVEERIPFDLEFFNKITNGGTPNKSLNIIMAGTGVGKSMFLCHHAASCMAQGKNVLYITCEMAEERIAERIDANLMDIPLDDLKDLPKDLYDKKFNRVVSKAEGKLIVKEYPTASASTIHFKHLLEELKMKKKFTPDIIFVDYLNICASSRMKMGTSINSYTYVKSIAEELRGLAVEYNVPIWSATQTNRSGYSNSDVGLENTSESFGLPATADFMFALITTDDLNELGQVLVKQLKNRYNDTLTNRKFVIGCDRPKMKFYDVEVTAQAGLVNTGQPLGNSFGSGFDGKNFEDKSDSGVKNNFSEWKI
jgi:replicative DNA helicase